MAKKCISWYGGVCAVAQVWGGGGWGVVYFFCPQASEKRTLVGECVAVVPLLTSAASATVASRSTASAGSVHFESFPGREGLEGALHHCKGGGGRLHDT